MYRSGPRTFTAGNTAARHVAPLDAARPSAQTTWGIRSALASPSVDGLHAGERVSVELCEGTGAKWVGLGFGAFVDGLVFLALVGDPDLGGDWSNFNLDM